MEEGKSEASSYKSERDVTDFVKYLLDGSGAESYVDYALLRKDLDGPSISSNILEGLSYTVCYNLTLIKSPQVDSYISHNPSSPLKAASEVAAPARSASALITNDLPSTSSTEILNSSLRCLDQRKQPRKSETLERAKILNEVSQQLISSGFPALSSALVPVSLTDRQAGAIRDTVSVILAEHAHRGKLVQKLHGSNQQSQESLSAQQKMVHDLEASHRSSVTRDSGLFTTLEKNLQASVDHANHMRKDSEIVHVELEKSRMQCDALKRTVELQDDRIKAAETKIRITNEKALKETSRTEKTFAEVTGKYHRDPKKNGIDRLTLEVIQAYERKIDALQSSASGSAKKNAAASKQRLHQDYFSNLDIEEFLHHKLEAELADTKELLQDTQSELDLLKLKHINILDAAMDPITRTMMSTRELIRLDKKRRQHNDNRIFASEVETSSTQHLENLITHVCYKLNIQSVKDLKTGLDDVENAIKLIPQMQQFITNIDAIVWDSQNVNISGGPRHLLSETFTAVAELFESRKRLEDLEFFSAQAMELAGLAHEDFGHCLLLLSNRQLGREEEIYSI